MFTAIKKRISSLVRRKSLPVGEHPMFLPGRDWKLLLISVIVLNVGIAGFAAYMFFQIQEQSFFGQESYDADEAPPYLQKNELTDVVEYYEQKRRNFESFQEGVPEIFDPVSRNE